MEQGAWWQRTCGRLRYLMLSLLQPLLLGLAFRNSKPQRKIGKSREGKFSTWWNKVILGNVETNWAWYKLMLSDDIFFTSPEGSGQSYHDVFLDYLLKVMLILCQETKQFCRWYKTGRGGWQIWWLHSHSDWLWQAGEIGQQKSHEVPEFMACPT